MQVKVKRMSDTAKMPSYGSNKACCFDVYADMPNKGKVSILPQETAKISIGLAFQPPEDYMLQILQRSGLASKGIYPLGGILDEDYRGAVCVLLHNGSTQSFEVKHGDKIAQIALRRYYHADFEEVASLDETERGSNGFGSTGV